MMREADTLAARLLARELGPRSPGQRLAWARRLAASAAAAPTASAAVPPPTDATPIRFSGDGRVLLGLDADWRSLVAWTYLGPASTAVAAPDRPPAFGDWFAPRFRLAVLPRRGGGGGGGAGGGGGVGGGATPAAAANPTTTTPLLAAGAAAADEVLSPAVCMPLRDGGRFVLLASCAREGGPGDEGAGAAAAPTTTATTTPPAAAEDASNTTSTTTATTGNRAALHVVDVVRGELVGGARLDPEESVELLRGGGALGVSASGDSVAVLLRRSGDVLLLRCGPSGALTEERRVGRWLRPDDALVVALAEGAEARCRRRQERRLARGGGGVDAGGEAAAATTTAEAKAAAAKAAEALGRGGKRGPIESAEGAGRAPKRRAGDEEGDDGGFVVPEARADDDDDGAVPKMDCLGDAGDDDAVVPEFDDAAAAAAVEVRAPAREAPAAPSPPPPPPLDPDPPAQQSCFASPRAPLSGLRQRLLAHAFLRAAAGRPSEACPSLADFSRYAYAELSRAVVRRARLTGAPGELLLALGVEEEEEEEGHEEGDEGEPTTGAAAATAARAGAGATTTTATPAAAASNPTTSSADPGGDGVRWLARYDWRSTRVRELRYVGGDAALAGLLGAPEVVLGLRSAAGAGGGAAAAAAAPLTDASASDWERAGAAAVRAVLAGSAAAWRLAARPPAQRAALAAQLAAGVPGAAAPLLCPCPLLDPRYLRPRFAAWGDGVDGGGGGGGGGGSEGRDGGGGASGPVGGLNQSNGPSSTTSDNSPMQLRLPFILYERAAWFAESGGGRVVFEEVVGRGVVGGGGGRGRSPRGAFSLDLRPLLAAADPLSTVGLLFHPHDPFVLAVAEQPPAGPIAPVEPVDPPPLLVFSPSAAR